MARTDDIDDLGRRLMQARAAERFVPYVEAREVDWAPLAQDCHRTVEQWAARHGGFAAVRGWLVFDFARVSLDLIGLVRFAAHSVLQAPDEKLIDITPSRAAGRYPFVVHPGTQGEFLALVEWLGIAYVDCRKSKPLSERSAFHNFVLVKSIHSSQ